MGSKSTWDHGTLEMAHLVQFISHSEELIETEKLNDLFKVIWFR